MALPDGWAEEPLGQAVDILIGCQRNPARAASSVHVPYLRSANVLDGRLDLREVFTMNFTPEEQRTYALVDGDVLVTEGSASPTAVGAAMVWAGELPGVICFQNTLLRFRAMPGVSDPRFVFHWARHAHQSGVYLQAAGSSILHLGAKRTAQLAMFRPPIEEQRSIASVLDRVDQLVAASQAEVAKLESIGRGLRQDFFDAGREVPSRPLVSLATNSGDYGSGAAARPYEPFLPRYIRITDITGDGRLAPDSLASISMAEGRGYEVRPNDLLFARSGSVGKAYLYDIADGPCVHAGYVIKFSLDESLCHPPYVAQFTRSDMYWRWVTRTMRQGAQPNINATEYASMEVPTPDIGEQRRVARTLAELDRDLLSARAALGKLRLIRAGVLDDLMTGRRRLPGFVRPVSEVA